MKHRITATFVRAGLGLTLAAGAFHATAGAQDRLKTMPGYEQYQKMTRELPGAVKTGALGVTWKDGRTFDYVRDAKLYRYDVATKFATEIGMAPALAASGRGGRGGGIERGRRVLGRGVGDRHPVGERCRQRGDVRRPERGRQDLRHVLDQCRRPVDLYAGRHQCHDPDTGRRWHVARAGDGGDG